MATTSTTLAGRPAFRERSRQAAETLRRAPLIPLAIIVIVLFTAIFAPLLTPHSTTQPSLADRLTPPVWQEGGTWEHPLGTDALGRDLATRLMYGGRVSMMVALFTLAIGGGVGTAIGLVSGYFGGRVDALFMRSADSTLAFPIILFAILLVVAVGPNLANVVIAVALVLWAPLRPGHSRRGAGPEGAGLHRAGAGCRLLPPAYSPVPPVPQHGEYAAGPADAASRVGDNR